MLIAYSNASIAGKCPFVAVCSKCIGSLAKIICFIFSWNNDCTTNFLNLKWFHVEMWICLNFFSFVVHRCKIVLSTEGFILANGTIIMWKIREWARATSATREIILRNYEFADWRINKQRYFKHRGKYSIKKSLKSIQEFVQHNIVLSNTQYGVI